MKNGYEYTVDTLDPITGHEVVVTAYLYSHGGREDYSDDSGNWTEIKYDPEFHKYTYENLETGEEGEMPPSWKYGVDEILKNIYWDRELNRE